MHGETCIACHVTKREESRERENEGRERERERERERLLLGEYVMELHTHQSIFCSN